MISTMPRDSLGRIVWLGDVTDEGYEVGGYAEGELLLCTSRIVHRLPANLVTVDLDASPERTNYERYFSDLGTREEVREAAASTCDDAICRDCPFDGAPWWCYDGFYRWLDEKAVV